MSEALETLTGVRLLEPGLLLWALLVPLAWGLRRWRGGPGVRFGPADFLRRRPVCGDPSLPLLRSSWRIRLLPLPRLLHLLGLLLVVVALARPVQRDELPLKTEGIDILLCLDVSSSMAATDMDPNRTRLEVARGAAADFIGGRPDDRIGLISFARYPDLRCPLTLDHRALQEILAGVQMVEREGPEDATGIGTALLRAAQVLRSSKAKSKVVILLTDGEENVATVHTPDEIAPIHAGQLCQELGVRVYTIVAGVGRPNGVGGWTPLDTRQVQWLARKTGGRFYEARDAGAVARVYGSINELERVELDEPRYRVRERFLPFLAAALLLLLGGRLLEATMLEVLP